jgi:hypothetical protein
MLKDEKTNEQISPMKSEVVGRLFILNDDDIQSVAQKFSERWRFTILELSCEFPLNYLTSFSQLEQAKL